MPHSHPAGKHHDIAVVGGGVTGLWTALEAARQGLSVILFEKRQISAGASGGVMGALMPHQPVNWDAKKQFQLQGLLSLEDAVADLQSRTGLDTGYRRCGRLMPIRNAPRRQQCESWAEAAGTQWPETCSWQVADASPCPAWLPDEQVPFGVNHDTLSARIAPRKLLAALKTAAIAAKVELREGQAVEFDGAGNSVIVPGGEPLAAGRIVLCAGWETFAPLDRFIGGESGTGIKGQSARLAPAMPIDPRLPIVYEDGTYAIAHDDGTVAIGSTTEREFTDPGTTDSRLDDVIARAQALCPALRGAEVLERWAGVRPRASRRDPLVGSLPDKPELIVATGGFKIGFGIAHLMARAAVMIAAGQTPDFLPDSFLPEHRFS
ncbi:NAD(P)/FAD-dependent oxidoreductase [Oricola sp.]|uniref:NAD(P)/FAD-dependent oxidoreductase n=1 Tax=Oricola sp. TaxID=1979950 RepID=UPI003BABE470